MSDSPRRLGNDRFTEVYNVDKLTGMLCSPNVCISTIQRVVKAIKNEEVTTKCD